MKSNKTEDNKLPLSAYIGVFLMEASTNPAFTIVSSFILLFYTDYIGLPAGACGIIILISKLMDGVSDLVGANIIQHTHTKAGSARPWLLRMSLPILVSTILMFTVPDMPQIGQFIYVFITYNLFCTVVFTMLACVTTTLPSLMTSDQKERSVLYVLKMIMAAICQLIVGFSAMRAVIALGNNQRAWIILAICIGIISMAFCLIAYKLCPEKVKQASDDAEKSLSFLSSIKIVFRNKYFWIMLGAQFMVVLIQTDVLSVGSYYAKYVLSDVTLAGNIIALFCLPAVFDMALLPVILKRFTKRNVALIGALLMVFSQIILFVNHSITGTYISLIIKSLGFGFAMATLNGMLSDSLDWSEYKFKERPTAMTMCGNIVAQKLASGIGTALLGFYLSMSGYDANPSGITSIHAITNCFVYIPIVFAVVLAVLYLLYDLDKKYPTIIAELQKRHQAQDKE